MPKTRVTIKDVYEAVSDLRDEVRDTYVTKSEFGPVRAIAFGIVGMASVTILGALLAKVVQAIGG